MRTTLARLAAGLALSLATAIAPPALAAVRFVVLGDAGKGNSAQYENGAALAKVCADKGCDLALYLGDNFYDSGLSSGDDPQLDSKFELPYASLAIPFYAVLGNHDYGNPPTELWKPRFQIAYTARSGKWRMPHHFYTFSRENVAFFGLDTQGIVAGLSHGAQQRWLGEALASSKARWKIVFGHHPYISNGEHGNAGNYEGCGKYCPDEIDGEKLRQLVEGRVCGAAQVYFSGHDHDLQWHQPRCGTEFIVSGAGASTGQFRYRANNPVFWESNASVGFLWVEIDGEQFTGEFYDAAGQLLYRRSFTKQQAVRATCCWTQ